MIKEVREFLKKTPLFPVLRRVGDMLITPPPSDPLRWQTIIDLGKKFNIHCLLETGTYLGATIDAVKNDFTSIYSVELDETLAKNAQEKFKNFPHIKIVQGDSSFVLPKLLPTINEPILFWLDAHYSMGVTTQGDSMTPIIKELENIFKLAKDFVILIDDARDFSWYSVVIRGRKDYPRIKELKKIINKFDSRYKIKVVDGMIRIYK